MARALKLAQRGRFTTHPNPNVGIVIVKDGEIVGEGSHQRAGEPHAEVHALWRVKKPKVDRLCHTRTLRHWSYAACCEHALIAAGVAHVPDARS